MKKRLFYLITLLSFFVSCNDEDEIIVIVGEYDSTLLIQEFSPPLNANYNLDTITHFYNGLDSIDLDLDGDVDIFIKIKIPTDKSPEQEYNDYDYSYARLILTDKVEVIKTDASYNCGMGMCGTYAATKALDINSSIGKSPEWSGDKKTMPMWQVWENTMNSFGPWYCIENEIKYIGIRVKSNDYSSGIHKYGWIKVNCKSHDNMLIESCAIEK